ncbi:MAG: PIG-L deacetylase family protein [Bacteroidota bacterium]
MLEFMGKTIAVVTAHPDDLEWFFGGTVCQLARGNRIVHIIATAGEKGTMDPELKETELAAARSREQLAAAQITGVHETVFFGFPDGDLAYGSLATLRVRLYRAMRTYEPDVLITFDPENRFDPHPDHITAGRLAFEAACLHPRVKYFPDGTPRKQTAPPEHYLFFGTYLHEPCLANDVSDDFEQKLRALSCHKSQNGDRWVQIEAWARAAAAENGTRIGVKYAETYRRLGWVNGELRPLTAPVPIPEQRPAKERAARKRQGGG